MASKYIPSVLKKKINSGKKESVIKYLESAEEIYKKRKKVNDYIGNEYDLMNFYDKYRKSPISRDRLANLANFDLTNKDKKEAYDALEFLLKKQEKLFLSLEPAKRLEILEVFKEHWENGITYMASLGEDISEVLKLIKRDTLSIEGVDNFGAIIKDPDLDIFKMKGVFNINFSKTYHPYGNKSALAEIDSISYVYSIHAMGFQWRKIQNLVENGSWLPGVTEEQAIKLVTTPFYGNPYHQHNDPYNNVKTKELKNIPDIVKNYQLIK